MHVTSYGVLFWLPDLRRWVEVIAHFLFPEYGWDHPLSEIINALLGAGLRLEFVHEFPYCGEQRFPFMVRGDDGWWRFAGKNDNMVPVLFSLRATKAG